MAVKKPPYYIQGFRAVQTLTSAESPVSVCAVCTPSTVKAIEREPWCSEQVDDTSCSVIIVSQEARFLYGLPYCGPYCFAHCTHSSWRIHTVASGTPEISPVQVILS